MLEKLFGPKHTLKDAMQILEKGLRNGEISVNAEVEAGHTPEEGPTQPNCRRGGGIAMSGSTDIVIPAKGDPEALDACVRMIREYWPQARFENALTGEKYTHYDELPFGCLRELFVYPDVLAESAWDQGEANAATNLMLYLILSPDNVTVVLDDPNTEEMRSMLRLIRTSLARDVLYTYAEAA